MGIGIVVWWWWWWRQHSVFSLSLSLPFRLPPARRVGRDLDPRNAVGEVGSGAEVGVAAYLRHALGGVRAQRAQDAVHFSTGATGRKE